MRERVHPTQSSDIATAPGDLPQPDIIERVESLAWEFRHDNTIVPLVPGPGDAVQVIATSGLEMPLRRAMLYYTTDGSAPDTASAAVPMESIAVTWEPHAGLVTRWQGEIPGRPAGTVVRYRIGGWRAGSPEGSEPEIWANDGQGYWFRYLGTEGITTFAYLTQPPGPAFPPWMEDAVVYHIFLDRFHPGNETGTFTGRRGPRERHGGTLAGVRRALPYLTDLGVTCLWFSPLHPSETYHRYDTMDYFGVDPTLGSVDDLRALTADAHDRGIRIWLDFVPNHASWHHPAFLAAQADRSAPTFPWFTFEEWPHRYRTFMQTSRYLPAMNTDEPAARAHLIEAAQFWVRDVGVDGFRLDHAIGPGMDFWVALRAGVESVKHDAVLVGEVTDTIDSLRRYAGKMCILDFPLARALRYTFATGAWDVCVLDSFLDSYDRYMSGGPGRVSFLDNHDMDRFLWLAGNDTRRLKMAATCQFTQAAPPAVYYGTEIGLTQQRGTRDAGFGGDAQARRDMPWDETVWDRDLLHFYRSLIRLRHNEPALRRGARLLVHLDADAGTYAYMRTLGEDRLVAAFNLSEAEREIPVPVAETLLSTGALPRLTDGAVTLPAMSAAILRA